MRTIPTITKNLLIINVIIFLVSYLAGADAYGNLRLNDTFGLHFFLAPDFHIYQLLTYMFMHATFTHLLFNMFALWMFGCVVENVWGPRKFLFYYISCGIGAGLFQEAAQFGQFYLLAADQIPNFSLGDIGMVADNSAALLNLWTTVGASGAIYAILLAFGMIFPEERIFIFPLPIPIKAKWFVALYAGIELFSAMAGTGGNVAHLAHLGGMVFGFFMIRYWRKHPTSGYGRAGGEAFFDNLHNAWERRSHRSSAGKSDREPFHTGSSHDSDWEYNARKQREQEEIDHILDKIRRSGYDSLTAEEKQKLFDSSNRS
ncbi:rhomboid family intramembrane serine protease [Prevotella sp. A2931]|uniref:Rhomboid family intramembrane serine protease n=1 Tax=Prevotella illustrans TaxID=2800387 RepID=A0ABS3M6B6_9BACT|nr:MULTISPECIES: rhomboid family intramembrane serine protease [Prevotella]MBO1363665.1 rhomboid family intramembrane serine protease [Prevotella illustrans]PTL26807.1 rhomboid family intramembrane serine protease [Prevotella sp. oral taxon 820]